MRSLPKSRPVAASRRFDTRHILGTLPSFPTVSIKGRNGGTRGEKHSHALRSAGKVENYHPRAVLRLHTNVVAVVVVVY